MVKGIACGRLGFGRALGGQTGPGDRLHEVDGLRALAMTGVIAQHCGLFPSGWIGVWLFFVISGFVITRGFQSSGKGTRPSPPPRPSRVGPPPSPGRAPYRRCSLPERGWMVSYRRFLGRRALRILPIYLGYVALGAALLGVTGNAAGLSDLPYLLSMTFNWQMIFGFWPGHGGFPAFGHLWTLSVEEQFYLVFPLFFLCLAPRPRLAATLALIAAGPVLRALASAYYQDAFSGDDERIAFAVYASSPCHFDAFLIGSLIAQREPRLRVPRNAGRLWAAAGLAGAAYLATYVMVNHAQGARGLAVVRNVYSGILYGAHREVFVYVAVDLLAAAALVHAVRRGPGSGVLALRPVTWVGRISYGGYLYHALVLWLIHQALGTAPQALPVPQRVLLFVVVWAATVALAGLSFHRLEDPLMQRFRRRRLRAAPASA